MASEILALWALGSTSLFFWSIKIHSRLNHISAAKSSRTPQDSAKIKRTSKKLRWRRKKSWIFSFRVGKKWIWVGANLSGIIGVDACSSRGAALVNESSVSKEVGGGWWSGCWGREWPRAIHNTTIAFVLLFFDSVLYSQKQQSYWKHLWLT